MMFMNHSGIFKGARLYLSLSVLAVLVLPAQAKPGPATNAIPQAVASVFIQPATPLQGRDPFFPYSKRPYESARPAQKPGADVSMLMVKGFVGTGPGRSAVINNHAFRAGEEGDVLTTAGRMHLRCIMVTEDSVVIESDGERHELKFHDNL